jgi:hypothetical protein
MAENAFAGRAERPTEGELGSTLGQAVGLENDLVDELRRNLEWEGDERSSYSVQIAGRSA